MSSDSTCMYLTLIEPHRFAYLCSHVTSRQPQVATVMLALPENFLLSQTGFLRSAFAVRPSLCVNLIIPCLELAAVNFFIFFVPPLHVGCQEQISPKATGRLVSQSDHGMQTLSVRFNLLGFFAIIVIVYTVIFNSTCPAGVTFLSQRHVNRLVMLNTNDGDLFCSPVTRLSRSERCMSHPGCILTDVFMKSQLFSDTYLMMGKCIYLCRTIAVFYLTCFVRETFQNYSDGSIWEM